LARSAHAMTKMVTANVANTAPMMMASVPSIGLGPRPTRPVTMTQMPKARIGGVIMRRGRRLSGGSIGGLRFLNSAVIDWSPSLHSPFLTERDASFFPACGGAPWPQQLTRPHGAKSRLGSRPRPGCGSRSYPRSPPRRAAGTHAMTEGVQTGGGKGDGVNSRQTGFHWPARPAASMGQAWARR